ncbi:MAG: serine/threonine protein kinase [Cyanobacteria bacterium TGS_CYA1]|nr:serine/threonine protein kinase [Cyanobacteria bacterium TGS_CYA1]
MSILVLFGWATGNYGIVRLIPDFSGDNNSASAAIPFAGQVNSTTAICLCFTSISLLILNFSKNPKAWILARSIGAFVLVCSALGIWGEMTGEELFALRIFQPEPSAPGITFPNPVVQEEAASLLLLGLALVSFAWTIKRICLSHLFLIASLLVPLLILFGAATKSPHLCAMGGCFQMSIGFSLLVIFSSLGTLLASCDSGHASLLASRSTGGALSRRGAAFLLILPLLLLLRTVLVSVQVRGYPLVEEPLSWAIFALLALVFTVWLIASGAGALERIETEKEEMKIQLEESEDLMRRTLKTGANISNSTNQSITRFKKICMVCSGEFDYSIDSCPNDGNPLQKVRYDTLVGTTFLDKYEILEELGSGGMSTVYKVKQVFLGKEFALKILKDSAAGSGDGIARFQREAQAAGALKHQGIISIQDFGLTPDGQPYMTMEYIAGSSLSQLLDKKSRLDLRLALSFMDQICEALMHAHENGIVHRDLKPSNIMLVTGLDGKINAKIVDFGIAKVVAENSENSLNLTKTGELIGSPLYMSPEQCRGQKIDHRSDIYSVGCVFYEMLVGMPPIVGKQVTDTILAHIQKPPNPFPEGVEIPHNVKEAIFKALEKEPDSRHQTMYDFKKSIFSN